MPSIRCQLPDAYYQMPTARCLLLDAYYQMHTIRCQLSDAYYWMSTSDVYYQMPPIKSPIRCQLPDAYYQLPTFRCLLSDSNLQMPTINCILSYISDAKYQIPTIRWLLPDTYYQMTTIRCLLWNSYYHANYLTEVWLSCSDVIQGSKPYFPIWQCCGICVIRIWSLHTYRMLTKCKQDSYFTKWWQPKTKPYVTTDANYILSRCLLSDSNYQ